MLTVLDLFCGCGGMGIAFKRAGFNILAAHDFDKYAVKSYAANVDPNVRVSDITEMTYEDIPQADVWTFGFPCQDLSVAGVKAGLFQGKRSRLFFEVMRLLEELESHLPENKPSVLLAENVKGLEQYLPVLREEFKKRGYRMYAKLFNSKHFGVPQHRERFYVVGIREDIKEAFNFTESPDLPFRRMIECMDELVEARFILDPTRAAQAVGEANGQSAEVPELGAIRVIADLRHYTNDQMNRVHDPLGLSPTLLTVSGGGRHVKVFIRETKQVRYLTPREYARIQGFPESYELVVSPSQSYKQLGNAVSVPVATHVAASIRDFLKDIHRTPQPN